MAAIDVSVIASLIGGIATILAALVSSLRGKKKGLESPQVDTPYVDTLIAETRAYLISQEFLEKRNRWSSGLLTFGQYIVGAVLATSFVQQSLSNQLIGFLGVIVILSSSFHQRFRPDIKAVGARSRIVRLRALIRTAEGQLHYKRNTVSQDSFRLVDEEALIAYEITKELKAIEESENTDIIKTQSIVLRDEQNHEKG